MKTHILYAYALNQEMSVPIQNQIEEEMVSFISQRLWVCPNVWAVKQTSSESSEVGLNLQLPEPYQEPIGWFDDVKAVVTMCVKLFQQFNEPFVIGISEGGITEDIIEVESETPDIEFLEEFIGVKPPSAQQGTPADAEKRRD